MRVVRSPQNVERLVPGPRWNRAHAGGVVVGEDFFSEVKEPIRFGGLGRRIPWRSSLPADRWCRPRMDDHLRIGVCFWHSFAWAGTDMFGLGTFDRPWISEATDPMAAARLKLAAAFEFFSKLGVPWYCFHDRDVAPEGASSPSSGQPRRLADDAAAYQERTGVRLLWGTANLFSQPRYAAGAATNPDPEVFAYAAAQVKNMLEVTKRLGGENYVLWGGREGYDTLLNTDLRREGAQLARFLHLVAEHKHRIGFTGTLLIEPKPMEPTKHQYDFDSATVHGFLVRNGLEGEYRLNIEANHATLAGHSFHHEIAYAVANGMFGSIDANRGDPQNGWDTDQFPNSVEDVVLPLYEILKAGGFTTGGLNFDAKLRRQSMHRTDLFHAHIGGIDTVARALLVAADMLEKGTLAGMVEERYAGWSGKLGSAILDGSASLADLAARVEAGEIDAHPVSGHQELFENVVNQHIWSADGGGAGR
jgi:xylose isomerase